MIDKRYVVISYTPLYNNPVFYGNKICDLVAGTIVWCNPNENLTDNSGNIWFTCVYKVNTQAFIGYLPDFVLEPFNAQDNVIKIKNATPNDSDFSQNIISGGNIWFNLCGHFSVLYCAGWTEFDFEDWLVEWAIKSPSLYSRLFYGNKSYTTGLSDLTNMFQSFKGYPEKFDLISDVFKFHGRVLFTPYKAEDILKNNRLLVGCKIESQYGRLRNSGIPHWVVIENVIPTGRGAIVHVYNPATNSIELDYSWDDLILSTGKVPYGMVIPR